MDLSESITPRSDQINADDLIAGPRTVTVADVRPGEAEQPVDIILIETPGRAYRPSKSMRRVIVAAWGKDSTAYVGRSLTLYRNPEITFGRDQVGGIEISHLSDIDKPLTVALTRSRGKRTPFTVHPITARDWVADADALDDLAALADLWRSAPDEVRPYIARRAEEIRSSQAATDEDVTA